MKPISQCKKDRSKKLVWPISDTHIIYYIVHGFEYMDPNHGCNQNCCVAGLYSSSKSKLKKLLANHFCMSLVQVLGTSIIVSTSSYTLLVANTGHKSSFRLC